MDKYFNNGTLPPAWYRDLKVNQAARQKEFEARVTRRIIDERSDRCLFTWWFQFRLRARIFFWNLGIR